MTSLKQKSCALLTPICCTAILVISLVAVFPVWENLYSIACHDEEASHVLLVPFVFAWLLWCSRARILNSPVTQRGWGLAIIGLGLALHEIGLSYSLQVMWHASAIFCVIGAMWLVVGRQVMRSAAPAVIVLFFMIPIPGLLRQELSLPVQSGSAAITEQVLTLFGTQVERNGCVLSVDGTAVTVAEACNGMRMLFAVLLVVYAMAFSLTKRRTTQVAILMLSPLLAVLANVVRLSISAWAYGVWSEEVASSWHDINGWLIPGVLIVAIILLTDSKTDNTEFEVVPSESPAGRHFGPTFLPTTISLAMLVACFVMNASRIPDTSHTEVHRARVTAQISTFPFCVGNWLGVPGKMHTDELRLLKPVAAFRRDYAHIETKEKISVVAVFTGSARDLVGHEPGICFSGQGWEVVSQSPIEWNVNGALIRGRAYEFRSGRERSVRKQVVSILVVAGQQSSGDISTVAKAAADFRLAPYGACSLQISSNQVHSDSEWRRMTQPFVREIRPVVNAFANRDRGVPGLRNSTIPRKNDINRRHLEVWQTATKMTAGSVQ